MRAIPWLLAGLLASGGAMAAGQPQPAVGQLQAAPAAARAALGLSVPVPRIIASGTTDTATTADLGSPGTLGALLKWTSANLAAKAQAIPACAPSLAGWAVWVKDGVGNAGTYNIVVSPASSTIDGSASYAISLNRQSIGLVCDGVSDWVLN